MPPDERIPAGPSPAPTPTPTPAPGPGPAPSSTPQGGTPTPAPGPVPYERFKEVNDQLKQHRDELASARKQNAEALQHIQKINAYLASLQPQPAKNDGRTPAQGTPGEGQPADDTEEKYVRQMLFGTDEQGQKAYEAMEQYMRLKLKKAGFVAKEEVDALVQQRVNQLAGQINSAIATPNRFNRWVETGMISAEEAKEMQGELNNLLATPDWQQASSNPNNVDYAVERLLTRAIESGKIKPFSKPRAPSPLQPGGGGAPAFAPPAPVEIEPDKVIFPSLKNLSKDQLNLLVDTSKKRYQGAI